MSRLVRLYPAAWRERYELELRDALASRPLTRRDRWGLVHGAADAWLHPELAEPASGELALVGHGSVRAELRSAIPWMSFLGMLAAATLALASFGVLLRPHGPLAAGSTGTELLAIASLALGGLFLLQRRAPITQLGGLTMIVVTVVLIAQGSWSDGLVSVAALAMGGAIAGLGGLVHARPGRLTGLALAFLSVPLAAAMQGYASRLAAVLVIGHALVALRYAAPGLLLRRPAVTRGALAGLLVAAGAMGALLWTDPWSGHDGYALGCHGKAAVCRQTADTMAWAIRVHFPGSQVRSIEVRADGQVMACWQDPIRGESCRLGPPDGWPSGPIGSI